MHMQLPPHEGAEISVVEMHTGGEPLRVILSGYPEVKGESLLDKRRYVRQHLDKLRRALMFEPRGHYDMYGALLVASELAEADLGVLFMHNEGYSTMCGHAVVALGRLAIDYGLVKEPRSPETQVNIHCPCGLVKAFVEYSAGKTGGVRFHSVPAFVFATGKRTSENLEESLRTSASLLEPLRTSENLRDPHSKKVTLSCLRSHDPNQNSSAT